VSQYRELPLSRFEHSTLLDRAFALRENYSAYDAVYVALAEGLDAPLVTADARLAKAARTWTEVEVTESADYRPVSPNAFASISRSHEARAASSRATTSG